MSKRELINAIIEHNRTAAPEFLARFEEHDLKAYLERVCTVSEKPSYFAGGPGTRTMAR